MSALKDILLALPNLIKLLFDVADRAEPKKPTEVKPLASEVARLKAEEEARKKFTEN